MKSQFEYNGKLVDEKFQPLDEATNEHLQCVLSIVGGEFSTSRYDDVFT